ncbi:unnamed protein product, partial [Mesorhabditis spiculigera]
MHALLIVGASFFVLANAAAIITADSSLTSDQLIPIERERSETPEQVFLRLDRNEDNHITFSEFLRTDKEYVARKMKEYLEADINGDNVIDFEEFIQSEKAVKTLEKAKKAKEIAAQREAEGEDYEDEEEESEENQSQEPEQTGSQEEDVEVTESPLDAAKMLALKRSSQDHFKIYDQDRDGLLNETEMVEMVQDYLESVLLVKPKKLLNIYDRNNNGGLEPREMWQLEKDMPIELIEPYLETDGRLHDEVLTDDELDELDLSDAEKNYIIFRKNRRKSENDEFYVEGMEEYI